VHSCVHTLILSQQKSQTIARACRVVELGVCATLTLSGVVTTTTTSARAIDTNAIDYIDTFALDARDDDVITNSTNKTAARAVRVCEALISAQQEQLCAIVSRAATLDVADGARVAFAVACALTRRVSAPAHAACALLAARQVRVPTSHYIVCVCLCAFDSCCAVAVRCVGAFGAIVARGWRRGCTCK
jgi:hypothetical protein